MINIDHQLIFMLINVLVLYYLMRRYLFTPMGNFLENRRQEIKSNLDTAEQKKQEAEELRARYEERLAKATEEAQQIIKEARLRGDELKAEAKEEAKEEADHMVNKAKEEIQMERNKAIASIKDEVANMTINVASKIVEENLDDEKHRELVEKYLTEAGEVS